MNQALKKISTLTLAFAAAVTLAGCGGCGNDAHNMKPHHHSRYVQQPQELVMYEAVEVVEAIPIDTMSVTAKMYTRSSRAGTSEMGYIKFVQGETGMKMMVDLIDLRPDKDYTVKIYPCGSCNDYSCCTAKSMNIKLPMLSIDEPGRLSKVFEIRGFQRTDLNNAKIVLSRDGGYMAAWGRLHQY